MATLRNYFLAVPGSASRKSCASFEHAGARSARTTNTDPQTGQRKQATCRNMRLAASRPTRARSHRRRIGSTRETPSAPGKASRRSTPSMQLPHARDEHGCSDPLSRNANPTEECRGHSAANDRCRRGDISWRGRALVTSLTRSPRSHTSRRCSRKPSIYWRPVRAGIAQCSLAGSARGVSIPRTRKASERQNVTRENLLLAWPFAGRQLVGHLDSIAVGIAEVDPD